MKSTSKTVVYKLPKALSNSKYKGKHLVLSGDRVVAAGSWKVVSPAVDKVFKQGKTPTIAYVPKADLLILIHQN